MVVIETGLLLTALPTILHIPAIANVAGACHAIVDRINSGPLLGWGSLAIACASLAGMAVAVARSRRLVRAARVEPWLGRHQPRDGYELVVVPTVRVLAMSVPSAPSDARKNTRPPGSIKMRTHAHGPETTPHAETA